MKSELGLKTFNKYVTKDETEPFKWSELRLQIIEKEIQMLFILYLNKLQTILMQKEMIVYKITIVIFTFFIVGCGVIKDSVKSQEDVYQIIEKVNYGEDGLYYKTLSYEQLPLNRKFSYDKINEVNVKYISITEKERFVNFDTIFDEAQRKEIDYRLKNLESVKLKKSRMSNPEVLSKIRTPYGNPMDEQKGINSVTFPVIVYSAKGVPFGFIYRNSSGLLHIYKKEENNWEEFARVEIHFVH